MLCSCDDVAGKTGTFQGLREHRRRRVVRSNRQPQDAANARFGASHRAATVTTRPFPASTGTTRMTISTADVQRLAHLARIEIDAVEAEDVRAKLDAIFAMINQLRAVDTTGVAPMAHAQDVCLPLRADKVTEADRHSLYQSVAPAVEDGLYLVPKVIE
jgi:aspartyl-tRNA(Asn)/glutamyl-tRNA(Gln) amidotransferase subunit C